LLGIKIVLVSPSLGTIFFSAISCYILLSNLLLQELLYISISGNNTLFFSARAIVSPSLATTVNSSQQIAITFSDRYMQYLNYFTYLDH
jgi:hypothetical protein